MSLLENAAPAQAECSNPFTGGPHLPDVCLASGGQLFSSLLSLLLISHPKIGDPCGRVRPTQRPDLIYDFIVVGGGAAGPVVASRLSENPKWKVLLLEAGPDEPAEAEVPANLQLFLDTDLDWKYYTSNESYACLNNKGRCKWPRGKNLGGCTTHHGMAYHRGHRKDYDRWVEMGNEGWSYDEVLPYYFKSEDNREIGRVRAQDHGTGGPMTVERFPDQPEFADHILQAASETGLGVSEDLVGEQITGFTVIQTISKDGVRQSTGASFLRPVRDRKNLHVTLNATVVKVLTSRAVATGVQYVKNGKKYIAKARKEVILSAGAINSPQLLLLSGIGPKEHLKSMKITPVVDLPGVGENLHNHASFGVDFTLNSPPKRDLDISAADLYLFNQTGPMSSTGLAQVTGILPSKYTTPDDPDIQIFFAGYQATCDSSTGIADLNTYNNLRTVRFTSVNVQTESRGRITLESKDPLAPPYIWSNELSHPKDPAIILEGLRYIFTLANSNTMRELGLTLVEPQLNGCEEFEKYSDEYWTCAIHTNTRPENHQSGTCKMGPASDPMAVVDPQLRVHKVKRLRVADASIMPKVVSGNPVAAINMIGERAADFIKKQYGVST